jgi:hypothetical protein
LKGTLFHPGVEISWYKRRKTLKIKIKDGNPSIKKYKANKNTSRHKPKKKQKQTINENQVKTLCKEDSWLRNDNQ